MPKTINISLSFPHWVFTLIIIISLKSHTFFFLFFILERIIFIHWTFTPLVVFPSRTGRQDANITCIEFDSIGLLTSESPFINDSFVLARVIRNIKPPAVPESTTQSTFMVSLVHIFLATPAQRSTI